MFERQEKQILRFAENDKKLALGNDAKHYQIRAVKCAVEESKS
jgi:hypothetical protein